MSVAERDGFRLVHRKLFSRFGLCVLESCVEMTRMVDIETPDLGKATRELEPASVAVHHLPTIGQVTHGVRGSTLPAPQAPSSKLDLLGTSLAQLNRRLSPEATAEDAAEMKGRSSERRTYPRRDAHLPVSVVRIETDEAALGLETERMLELRGVTGELLDLSRNGLAVIHQEPLEIGERMVVRLCGDDPRTQRDQLATVVRVVEIADGRWKIVAQFAAPLEFEVAYELFDRCEFLSA